MWNGSDRDMPHITCNWSHTYCDTFLVSTLSRPVVAGGPAQGNCKTPHDLFWPAVPTRRSSSPTTDGRAY